MIPTVWVLVAFLAGTATGALMLSIVRMATLSRIREEFEVELLARIENRAEPAHDEPEVKRPPQAA